MSRFDQGIPCCDVYPYYYYQLYLWGDMANSRNISLSTTSKNNNGNIFGLFVCASLFTSHKYDIS